MTTSKIIVDADHGKVDSAAKKTANEYRKVANEAGAIGNQLGRIGNQLVGKAAGLTAILGTLRAINEEAKRVSDASVAASEKGGDRALKMGAAVRSLGLDKGTQTTTDIFKQVSDLVGARSSNELSDFLSNAAQQKGMTGERAMRGLRLYASGLVTDKEAMDPKANLERLEAELPSRQGALSYYEERELATRTLENRADLRRDTIEQVGGRSQRVGRAEIELARAQRDLASNIGLSLADRATLGTVQNGRESNAAAGVEARLDEQIRLMRQAQTPRPTMATTTESGP